MAQPINLAVSRDPNEELTDQRVQALKLQLKNQRQEDRSKQIGESRATLEGPRLSKELPRTKTLKTQKSIQKRQSTQQ